MQGSNATAIRLEEARDYIRAHARAVRDIMTREVISVDETTDLTEVATLMETKRIKRVPVLRDGMLVGILSRANLVRAARRSAASRQPALPAATAKSAPSCWPNSTGGNGPGYGRKRLSCRVPGVSRVEEHVVPVPIFPAF